MIFLRGIKVSLNSRNNLPPREYQRGKYFSEDEGDFMELCTDVIRFYRETKFLSK